MKTIIFLGLTISGFAAHADYNCTVSAGGVGTVYSNISLEECIQHAKHRVKAVSAALPNRAGVEFNVEMSASYKTDDVQDPVAVNTTFHGVHQNN